MLLLGYSFRNLRRIQPLFFSLSSQICPKDWIKKWFEKTADLFSHKFVLITINMM
jgi:hypothetical protein